MPENVGMVLFKIFVIIENRGPKGPFDPTGLMTILGFYSPTEPSEIAFG